MYSHEAVKRRPSEEASASTRGSKRVVPDLDGLLRKAGAQEGEGPDSNRKPKRVMLKEHVKADAAHTAAAQLLQKVDEKDGLSEMTTVKVSTMLGKIQGFLTESSLGGMVNDGMSEEQQQEGLKIVADLRRQQGLQHAGEKSRESRV